MNKTILAITVIALITGTVFTSCNSSADRVDNAEQALIDADKELKEANEAYLLDIENYRMETADKIAANNKSIADFNLRIENEKKEVKAEYKKQIAELEQKNSDMEKKMDDYQADGKQKWEAFKTEFSHDMDELGKAFTDLTVNNTKK